MAMFARVKLPDGKAFIQNINPQTPQLAIPKGAQVEMFGSVGGKVTPLSHVRKATGKPGEDTVIVTQDGQEVAIKVQQDGEVVATDADTALATEAGTQVADASAAVAAESAGASAGTSSAATAAASVAAPVAGAGTTIAGLSLPVVGIAAAGVAAAVTIGATSSAPEAVTPKAFNLPVKSTTTDPQYLVGTGGRAEFYSIITTPNKAGNGYVFDGTPDGIGAYDNGDGTLTVLVNHEFGNTAGSVRDHGSVGSYVSKLIVDKATLQVKTGSDLLSSKNNLYLADSGTGALNAPGTTTAFGRFCSGDLAAKTAFLNGVTGYDGLIYMTGEEIGAEGRAFAFVVTGSDAGKTYELSSLGNMSFENLLANPITQAKTIVAANEDSSSQGQVYFYIGEKNLTGANAIEKAGLTNGHLFGVKVSTGTGTETGTTPSETGLGLDSAGTSRFSLFDLGDVKAKSGSTINTESVTAGVTNFLRPEDGAWSLDGKTYYFVTTASSITASRLWALEFDDISHPENGGKIKMLLDGSEGQVMMDNITVTHTGRILIQEDPGANDRVAKIWSYDPATDKLTEIAQHNPELFSGANKITNDEESSGIIDITKFLEGQSAFDTKNFGYYLVADQVHKALSDPASAVENGQLDIMAVSQAFA